LAAKVLGVSIFTEAQSLDALRAAVKNDVEWHFNNKVQRKMKILFYKLPTIFN